ncbi:MAG TPA: DnaA regulatory inactivator Hda [Gammaproteobacteria bacterium]|nr:DnaA regulatory inactivator Hda [Gammaproteobacteria bacterium]
MADPRFAQLPLGVGLRDDATFTNFLPGPNAGALAVLEAGNEQAVYLWGGWGSGRTHLLQAACHAAAAAGGAPAYLPLSAAEDLAPAMLEGLEVAPLVCLDDVQAVAGRADWERGLFDLYNRVREAGGRLVAAADAAPGALGLVLPDLASRLAWGPVYHLEALSDDQKKEALCRRAERRGMELGEDVATYLLRRCPRDLHSLFGLLERLDHTSLAAQRRLTIPFVRQVLG